MREIDRIIPSKTYQEHNCPRCLKNGKMSYETIYITDFIYDDREYRSRFVCPHCGFDMLTGYFTNIPDAMENLRLKMKKEMDQHRHNYKSREE